MRILDALRKDIAQGAINQIMQYDRDVMNYPSLEPMHLAALHGHVEMLSLLLDRGFDVNALDSKGRSALYDAVSRGHESAVQYLESRGATTLSVEESKAAWRDLDLWLDEERIIEHADEMRKNDSLRRNTISLNKPGGSSISPESYNVAGETTEDTNPP